MAGISCGFMPLGGGNSKEWERMQTMQNLQKIFQEIDLDRDGLIKIEAFVNYLKIRNIEIGEEDIEVLKRSENEDGKVRCLDIQKHSLDSNYFQQFKEKQWDLVNEINTSNTAFRMLDRNGDGFLTKKEFSKSMRCLSDYQVEKLFQKYDADKDDKLSAPEFKNIMNAKKRKAMNKVPEIKITSSEYP